jgi:isoleucyl-tRNA synthetase
LDAEVDIYADGEIAAQIDRLGDELRFVLITSYARRHPASEHPADAVEVELKGGERLWLSVTPSEHAKCVRCWHHREDVGASAEHPELCERCVDNVAGGGEQRSYA